MEGKPGTQTQGRVHSESNADRCHDSLDECDVRCDQYLDVGGISFEDSTLPIYQRITTGSGYKNKFASRCSESQSASASNAASSSQFANLGGSEQAQQFRAWYQVPTRDSMRHRDALASQSVLCIMEKSREKLEKAEQRIRSGKGDENVILMGFEAASIWRTERALVSLLDVQKVTMEKLEEKVKNRDALISASTYLSTEGKEKGSTAATEIRTLKQQLSVSIQERTHADNEAKKAAKAQKYAEEERDHWRRVRDGLAHQCQQNQKQTEKINSAIDTLIEGVNRIYVAELHGEPESMPPGFSEHALAFTLRVLNAACQEKSAAVKQIGVLKKQIGKKDGELKNKELEFTHAAQASHNRQQELKSQTSKIESALDLAKRELEKAKKEPEKVREEFSAKLQRLHDKIRGLEEKLKTEQEARNIIELDHEATLKDSDALKGRVENQKGMLKEWKSEYTKLKADRDQLQSRLPRQTPNLEAEDNPYRKSLEKLNKEKNELEEKLRSAHSDRIADTKTIQELSRHKDTSKKELEKVGEMEQTLKNTLDELEKERSKAKLVDHNEAFLELQRELAQEKQKSMGLELKLAGVAPILAAAAAASASL